jgi:hypothetical protein
MTRTPRLVALSVLVALAISSAAAQTRQTPAVDYVGRFSLAPASGPAGTIVTATGSGLPAHTPLDVVWNAVEGRWLLAGEYDDEFRGREFLASPIVVGSATTDAAGDYTATFTVPTGWGFHHDVTLHDPAADVIRNQAPFAVDMEVTISPTSGPVGTPITIEAQGIGHRYMFNSWVLVYDNRLTGWLSSVTTNGRATAVIPATGAPGTRVIQVVHSWSSQSYLNPQQSDAPERPSFTFEFTVTDGDPVLPPAIETQGLPPRPGGPPAGSDAALWTDPATGPVGTPVRLGGRGLPAGQEVELLWARQEGSRLEGREIAQATTRLGTATAGADGSISFDFLAPDDLGGMHPIAARHDGAVLAKGGFVITPSVIVLEPTSGPVGTTIRLQMKGVGWTETANIYHLVYDNGYLGYACGFKSQGDVEIFLPATGEPGWRFIDLYPGIYKGSDVPGVLNFRVPQLTAEHDHPGEDLPVFRLAFEVVH